MKFNLKIPAAFLRIHHGYIGLVLMAIGLALEIYTWDEQGNFKNMFPFQDVIAWCFVGLGFGLFASDLIEHFFAKEKHTEDIENVTKKISPKKP